MIWEGLGFQAKGLPVYAGGMPSVVKAISAPWQAAPGATAWFQHTLTSTKPHRGGIHGQGWKELWLPPWFSPQIHLHLHLLPLPPSYMFVPFRCTGVAHSDPCWQNVTGCFLPRWAIGRHSLPQPKPPSPQPQSNAPE